MVRITLRCGRNKDRTRPWGTRTALTPLMTSYSRFSFTLYLASQQRRSRCLNNKLPSLSTDRSKQGGKNTLKSYSFHFQLVTWKSWRVDVRHLPLQSTTAVWSHHICQFLCDSKRFMAWLCTCSVSWVSLQKGIDDDSRQTLCQSLEESMLSCQSRSEGGPGASLTYLETQWDQRTEGEGGRERDTNLKWSHTNSSHL